MSLLASSRRATPSLLLPRVQYGRNSECPGMSDRAANRRRVRESDVLFCRLCLLSELRVPRCGSRDPCPPCLVVTHGPRISSECRWQANSETRAFRVSEGVGIGNSYAGPLASDTRWQGSGGGRPHAESNGRLAGECPAPILKYQHLV